ncbi:MAG: beta strand repeat-containing protein, partial [Planctomycetaceae bacterium]
DITVQTTAGRLTLQNITASSGSVVLRTFESGGILADNVSASGTILANSANFIAELNEDPAADLQAAQIQLVAVNGIGSDGKLIEVDGPDLKLAAATDRADIRLHALGSVTAASVLANRGLIILNNSGTAAPGTIELTSAGSISIDESVVNRSRGSIRLQADGNLQQAAATTIETGGNGTVTLNAGAVRFGSQGTIGNFIQQDDGAQVVSDQGQITLQATGDIRLSRVISSSGNISASAGGTLTPGSILDNTQSESPNLTTGGLISLFATADIGDNSPAQDIDISAPELEASATFGSINIRSAGPVRLAGQGLRTSGAAGNIYLANDAGNIDAAAEVSAANAGNIRLEAADLLTLRKRIASDTGFITLNGSKIVAEADGDVFTAANGSIVLNAFNQDILLDPGSSLTAQNGLISLQAQRHIFLSELNTGGNVVAVSVTGDIFDNNDDTTGRRLNVSARNLTLTANSIGNAPASFFTDLPDGLEIDLTGTLTVQAQSFAALHGNISGTGTLAAETLFLMSDLNIVFSSPGTPLVKHLALLADLDNNGTGTLTLQNPVAVTGNLRISAADIDGGTGGTQLAAHNLLFQSARSESLRINLQTPANGTPAALDARSAASLQIVADSSVELRDLNGDGHAFSSSAADGNLELAVTGNLNVSSKVLAAGNIVLTSTGSTAINAEVDPETVTISANDDIVITSQIVATKLIAIAAGSDGTGSLQTTGTSSIKAGGSATSGDIALSAGSNSGNMLLNGTISAADSLTANAA